jgi:hypothetical protein
MNSALDSFSPRDFLRSRRAVLVHFSTDMSGHPELVFPNDLRQAIDLTGTPLSFSTIQPGDSNPYGNERGGAGGSIGLLIDIGPETTIQSVHWTDSGSNEMGSLGHPPTAESCANSIDRRRDRDSNEWRVQDYVPVGIFIFDPIYVRQIRNLGGVATPVPTQASLQEAITPFPKQRIFSATQQDFIELERASTDWRPIEYDKIFHRA